MPQHRPEGTRALPRSTLTRRRAIWAALSAKGALTTRHLAARFGVSLDTIHKDLAYLRHLGYIKRSERGVTGVQVLIPLATRVDGARRAA